MKSKRPLLISMTLCVTFFFGILIGAGAQPLFVIEAGYLGEGVATNRVVITEMDGTTKTFITVYMSSDGSGAYIPDTRIQIQDDPNIQREDRVKVMLTNYGKFVGKRLP